MRTNEIQPAAKGKPFLAEVKYFHKSGALIAEITVSELLILTISV
jgi:hypothetical protein